MKITVRLFASLSAVSGTRELELCLDEGAGLMDIVKELSARFGPGFNGALYSAQYGPLNPFASVAVDGRTVLLTPDADVNLDEGSVVAFLPPLGGG